MFDAEILFASGWVPCRVVAMGPEGAAVVVAVTIVRNGEVVNATARVEFPEGAMIRLANGTVPKC